MDVRYAHGFLGKRTVTVLLAGIFTDVFLLNVFLKPFQLQADL